MKTILSLLLTTSFASFAFSAEWCPKYQGKNPQTVVDLGQYKLFYFLQPSNNGAQKAVTFLTKDNTPFAADYETEINQDWFSSDEYTGYISGFKCDGASMQFEEAWLMNEYNQQMYFNKGEVRSIYSSNKLDCQ